MSDETIEVLTREGKPWRVGRAKFEEMARVLMATLPTEPPGMTFAELQKAALPKLDPALFPGGAKAGWWAKSVQLDHEYRGLIVRTKGSPLRFHRS